MLLALVLVAALLPEPASATAPSSYIRLHNGRLAWSGHSLTPCWATFYPYWRHNGRILHGGAWSDPAFKEYIDSSLSLASSVGLGGLRASDFLDGAADWRDPTVWSNMDYFVDAAARRGMFVIISIDAYRKWLIKRRMDPYNPLQWGTFLQFFAARYRSAPNILYVPIAGEVPPPNSKQQWKATAAQYVAFFRSTLAALHELDPNHLHAVGGLSFLNHPRYGIPWQQLFSLPYNDLADMHLYSQGDLRVSLPMLSAWCAEKRMPLLVEEFGAKQSMGDAERAAYFETVFAAARQYGAAGIGFWNLGPEIAPGSYEVGPQTPRTLQAVEQSVRRFR